MADSNNKEVHQKLKGNKSEIQKKLAGRNTIHMDPVIDRHYQLIGAGKSKEIIQRAMDLAREEIPKGAVATYIPELGKMDPHQLGICLYPLKGDKITLGDCDVRFTMQSVSKVIMLIVALEVCGLKPVFRKVGMEPSGEAFDSLVELDVNDSKPYNPLINNNPPKRLPLGGLLCYGGAMAWVGFRGW